MILPSLIVFWTMKDARLLFRVHGRKFYLAPPRRPGGPYYIRFEPPSNQRTRIRVVHRSLRTSVIAAAKAFATDCVLVSIHPLARS